MNYQIFFISLLFWAISTNYFGWNMNPQSDVEIVCDGITMIILSLAFIKK